jgi:hypothetical protein
MAAVQLLQKQCSIAVRQVHIRHHQIDRLLGKHGPRVRKTGRENRLAIHRLGDQIAEDVEHSRLVIHHQHTRTKFT